MLRPYANVQFPNTGEGGWFRRPLIPAFAWRASA